MISLDFSSRFPTHFLFFGILNPGRFEFHIIRFEGEIHF